MSMVADTRTRIAETRARIAESARRRAALSGKPPRIAYTHYFIETEGFHSRIHLQNFYSTFWPQVHEPATAHISAFDAGGRRQGNATRSLPPFGSLFLEVSELLSELGSRATEGTVAIDLEPSAEVAAQFHELPDADQIEVKTPFWMAYYDEAENFMYVHSIDTLGGEVFGAPALLRWSMTRHVGMGSPWRSWRLLEADRLSELQIVCMNTSPEPRVHRRRRVLARRRGHALPAVVGVSAARGRPCARARRAAAPRGPIATPRSNTPGSASIRCSRQRQAVRDHALRRRPAEPAPRLAVRSRALPDVQPQRAVDRVVLAGRELPAQRLDSERLEQPTVVPTVLVQAPLGVLAVP